ncbi:MAG: glycosyltransferase family 4 protein [Actinomycetota bacterium]|nr:glycosyltransferase family 4 protein [Actinomycetota bacterium]
MRIGFFTDTYTPQINGVVTSIRLFKRALEARGHEVYVFAPDPEHDEDGEVTVRFPSMPFAFQPEMRLASPFSMDALRLLDAVDFDVVHSHDPFSIGLFGHRVARRHAIPYVHTYHTLYPEYVHYVWETRLTKSLARRLSREFCEACNTIIAPSTKIEQFLREWGVTVPIEVIATGVDIARYGAKDDSAVESLRTRLGLRDSDRVALFMGRLGREKSIETLIRAIWHSRHSTTKLVIAGDGPDHAELARLARDLGLGKRVVFAGYLRGDEAVAAYHAADVFAFASTSETQGLVIGEAMAAGLPVVAVEDLAVQDFVVHGATGFLVPGRPEDVARSLDNLLADDDLRSAFATASRERAGQFSIGHQAERLENHYLQAIEEFVPRKRSLARLRERISTARSSR